MPSPNAPSGGLALITGGSGGIGAATCLALADLGYDIAIHYNSNAEKAKQVETDVVRRCPRAKVETFQADLSSYDEVRRLHKEVVKTMGHPTILFANAGLTLGKSGVKDISVVSVEDFELTWRANCGSAYLLTQLCIPDMLDKEFGRVIFCSSVAGFTGGVVGPHYASSKSALHGLVHWLAGAYAKKGITVNGVAPALIQETTMLPGRNDELAQSMSFIAL